jgi:hypothetical protein
MRVTINRFRQDGLRGQDGVGDVWRRDRPLPARHRRLLLVRVLRLAQLAPAGGQQRRGRRRLKREVVVVAGFEAHAVHVAVVGVHSAAGKHPGEAGKSVKRIPVTPGRVFTKLLTDIALGGTLTERS